MDYEKNQADKVVYRSSPCFSHQFRREGTILWSHNGTVNFMFLTTYKLKNVEYEYLKLGIKYLEFYFKTFVLEIEDMNNKHIMICTLMIIEFLVK